MHISQTIVTSSTELFSGKSQKISEYEAVSEATEMALEQCDRPCFGFVFTTHQYDPQLIAKALNEKLKNIPWAGCTSAGVFYKTEFIQHGIVLGLICAPQFRWGVGVSNLKDANCREAGAIAVRESLEKLGDPVAGNIRSLIVLADAKSGNIPEVIRGAVYEAGMLNVWAGGGVGSLAPDARIAEFALGKAFSSHVVVIAIDTPTSFVTGVNHGWRPFGPPIMVTRSSGNVTFELEYEKAFKVYQETAISRGETVTEENFLEFSMTHPLGIPQSDGTYVIRDILNLNSDGSLNFIAEVPDGCLVRVMEGATPELLDAAKNAAGIAKKSCKNPMTGALIFDCISRFLIMKENYGKELNTFQVGLGKSIPFVGCLTVGEICSFGRSVPQFHNKSTVVMGFQ